MFTVTPAGTHFDFSLRQVILARRSLDIQNLALQGPMEPCVAYIVGGHGTEGGYRLGVYVAPTNEKRSEYGKLFLPYPVQLSLQQYEDLQNDAEELAASMGFSMSYDNLAQQGGRALEMLAGVLPFTRQEHPRAVDVLDSSGQFSSMGLVREAPEPPKGALGVALPTHATPSLPQTKDVNPWSAGRVETGANRVEASNDEDRRTKSSVASWGAPATVANPLGSEPILRSAGAQAPRAVRATQISGAYASPVALGKGEVASVSSRQPSAWGAPVPDPAAQTPAMTESGSFEAVPALSGSDADAPSARLGWSEKDRPAVVALLSLL